MSVHLVKGSDALLRDRVVEALVVELLAGEDRSLALEDVVIPGRGTSGDDGVASGGHDARDAAMVTVINAATSPPFMTAARVVVVRDVGALTAAEAEPLVRYLGDPLETTALVLVAGGGTTAANLAKQLKAVGAVERAPASEKTSDVLADEVRAAGLKLRPDAAKLVSSHLGEDAGRVRALVDVLGAAHQRGAVLGTDDVAPYLGDAGSVPGYQLTNAIEAGDAAQALETLHRLLTVTSAQQPKPMHPLQIMGTLTNSYRRMLRCDDPSITGVDDAVAALGGRVSAYPARRAMEQARALGFDGIRAAFDLLAQADLDLKGARAIPEDAVMEVLVVRLARLSAGRAGAPRRPGSRSAARR
jgi:DNA polymerase-3 subunit delta